MTTRTLVILRHAKAANPEGVADIDRPLTARGHADAVAAGAWMALHTYVPDVVLCSPARRTRETWHGVALALTRGPEVRYDDTIYNAATLDLLRVVTEVAADAGTVLLIGHNPGVSQLAAMLDPASAETTGLRTAGLSVHDAPTAFNAWTPGVARQTATHTARSDD